MKGKNTNYLNLIALLFIDLLIVIVLVMSLIHNATTPGGNSFEYNVETSLTIIFMAIVNLRNDK